MKFDFTTLQPQSWSREGKTYLYFSLPELAEHFPSIRTLPYSLQILLENLLRHQARGIVQKKDIEALLNWKAEAEPEIEIQFTPGRTVLQDFTGVPAIADLASLREAIQAEGGRPETVNPLQPVDLVIDHSVQVDFAGSADALEKNTNLEFARNQERYQFLKWAQNQFQNLRVVPPGTGIIHQVNLEYLSKGVLTSRVPQQSDTFWIYPETLVGTDSHTTMINGLGILGWGVGGIEAEAALLGQPCSMLIPQVIGVKLEGKLPLGTTATDLVLTLTHLLRKKGVVGKFVEFFGSGVTHLSLADRATLANMAPEYGATVGLFPVDAITTDYLEQTGRTEAAELVKTYFQKQGWWWNPKHVARYSDTLELSLAEVEPCLAGPSRPQDRVFLSQVRSSFEKSFPQHKLSSAAIPVGKTPAGSLPPPQVLGHGSVVIAAITSCTNTSNPHLLVAAGLLAQKAQARGLKPASWVKTSFAPGSQAVTHYLKAAGLLPSLEALGFHVTAYGCTTCIGNSGPLDPAISQVITNQDLTVAAVLSGNRNFEGRVHPQVKANYLGSPALVIAYALAGSIGINLSQDPIGYEANDLQKPVFLKDLWPNPQEIDQVVQKYVTRTCFETSYRSIFEGSPAWKALSPPSGITYPWQENSSYLLAPPFLKMKNRAPEDVKEAAILALFGDSITTDHISPAGSISKKTPAGLYLSQLGVAPQDFNSYGARRGNHEVMVRGTFANPRIQNKLTPHLEGGITWYHPEKKQVSIYSASLHYKENNIPLVVIAGKEYGTGSSRDWAAKGTLLLGVRAVLAESFERIHRSNLVGMGVLPLQFQPGESATRLGLEGPERLSFSLKNLSPSSLMTVDIYRDGSLVRSVTLLVRIDTPHELRVFLEGGTLPYMKKKWAQL